MKLRNNWRIQFIRNNANKKRRGKIEVQCIQELYYFKMRNFLLQFFSDVDFIFTSILQKYMIFHYILY